MNRMTLGALLGALVLAPAVASAQPATAVSQDLPFTTITKSGFGHTTADRKTITTEQDYKAWFGGTAPATPAVDFTNEDVLAVAMGQEPSTGYAIEITRVEYMTTGITGGMAFVHIQETKPAPGSIVGWVVTSPTHVVKLSKKATSYVFVTNPTPAAWDKLSLQVLWGSTGYTGTLTLAPPGAATLLQSSPTGKYAPINDTATAAELKAVNDAFTNADVKTLPAGIPDPRMIIGVKKIELVSTVSGTDYKFDASIDYYGTVDARVKPLVDALKAISDRLATGTAKQNFDKLTLSMQGGFILKRDDYVVAWDGTVTVLDRMGMGPTRPFTGQATKAELQAIKDAFTACDVTTLPATINPPHLIPDVASFNLDSAVAGTDYNTLMVQGAYGTYEKRLKPLVEAIRTCGQRVLQASLPQSVSGLVSYHSGTLTVGTYTVSTTDKLRSLVYSFRGKTISITVTGTAIEWIDGTVNTTANLRKSASYLGKVIETLNTGDQVQITGKSSSGLYYKATAPNGQVGWVFVNYVDVAK
jgi:hypothetical protein